MLKKKLFSAPSNGLAKPSRNTLVYFLAFALITGLALLPIGLNPGPLSAQGSSPSEITAGQVRIGPIPPAATTTDPTPALSEETPTQPADNPAGALPSTPETVAPAQTTPAATPNEAAAEEAPAGLSAEEELTEITKELAKADTSYRQGDYIAALDSLWAAQEMMWRRAPLGVRNVAFVSEQPDNFGTYKPKIGEDFKSPEPLIFYCEPIGFTQIKENDTYRYSIIGAFDILDARGKVLGGQKNLGPYEQSGYRTFSTETMLVMTIGIHGLPAGSYVMRITLTDNLDRTKSVQLDKPFNIIVE